MGSELPYFFLQLTQFMSFLTLDVTQVLDFGCVLAQQNHITSLYLSTALPALAMLVVQLMYAIVRAVLQRRPRIVSLIAPLRVFTSTLQLGITFVVYPTLSATILRTFNCMDLDDGSRVLVYDPSVDCLSDQYAQARLFAGFMCAVVIAGVPLTYAGLLWSHRRAMNPSREGYTAAMLSAVRDEDRTIAHLRFLWEPYVPRYYAFEVFEQARKLAQTSLVTLVPNGSAAQIVVQLIISFVAISVLSGLRPYRRADDNTLATFAQWVIFAVAFISLVVL